MSGAEECPASSISSARACSSAWEMLPEPSVLPVAEGASQRLDAALSCGETSAHVPNERLEKLWENIVCARPFLS